MRGGGLPNCEKNTYLKKHTWIHRGGKVNYWWHPKDKSELVLLGEFLYKNNQNFIVIGHTSNIYFKNSYNIEHVIDTRKLTSFYLDDKTIVCDCGTPIARLSKWAVEYGIIGYEGLINLPGTVAGAIVNNSGCYHCGIDKILKSVELLTPNGIILNIEAKKLNYKFRNSALKTGDIHGIILRAFLDASNKAEISKLKEIAEINSQNRLDTQDPPAYNLGTTINFGYYKKNFRNIIIRIVDKCCRLIIKDSNKRYRIKKNTILTLYGKLFLNKYISNKRMGCYIWKDDKADIYFEDYLSLMDNVYSNTSIEIEIKE